MPPKFNPDDPATAALITLFTSLGVAPASATELVKQPKQGQAFKGLIEEFNLQDASADRKLDEKQAAALVKLATTGGKLGQAEKGFVVQKVLKGDLKSADQVTAAIKFLETNPTGTPVNEEAFDKACGVGINLALADLPELISSYVSSLTSQPDGWPSLMPLFGGIKNSASDLRWANPTDLKTSLESHFTSLFGSQEAFKAQRLAEQARAKEAKVAAGQAKVAQAKAAAAAVNHSPSAAASGSGSGPGAATPVNARASDGTPVIPTNIFQEGFLSEFHRPGENPQIEERLKEGHLDATKGQVFTRFPPEPNGFLHIGHVKAIMIDFGYAKYHGGNCYLRFDDTNPEAEEGRFFQSILESVRWLGFEPWKITYSSDNFQRLYELAVELIRRGKGYVCTCDVEKIKEDRGSSLGAPKPCIHRERPIEESLAEFERMKNGEFAEKTACLRMKMDLSSGNPYMWDAIAYRVKLAPHHRTGDKWKIYPTYDFTHCLCDSFENISHSLCTTEFITARESYEWLCDALSVYKPRQYEFARLNLQGTFLSKRKIAKLVQKEFVSSWDDPRLYTLIGLRRRGIPPGALLRFVSDLGVTVTPSVTTIKKFESVIRGYLEDTAPRVMMVLEPIKLVIENVPDDYRIKVQVPLHPKVPAMGTIETAFTKEVYIDAEDFRTEDSPDYFRLAPGKSVGLFKAPFPVTCTSFSTDPATGAVTEIRCKLEDDAARGGKPVVKPKAFVQWVSAPDAIRLESVRYFHPLFKSDPPPAEFETDIAPDSITEYSRAVIEPAFRGLAAKMYGEAREAAERRTAEAKRKMDIKTEASSEEVAHAEDEPEVLAESLYGPEDVRFQGMRLAYFALDKESVVRGMNAKDGEGEKERFVLNRIVSLKEDAGKKA